MLVLVWALLVLLVLNRNSSASLRMLSVRCVLNALKDMVFECSLIVDPSVGTRTTSSVCDDDATDAPESRCNR